MREEVLKMAKLQGLHPHTPMFAQFNEKTVNDR